MLYQTCVKVHLGNIRSNIEGIRKAVGRDRKILAAVKANAYGHGAVEVSRMAERSGVDWLGVATVPEGLQLRRAGIGLPILKFSPAFPEEMEAAIRADLAIAVCDKTNVEALESVCRASRHHAVVHLKIDTGMGRIGVSIDEAASLASFIERSCHHLRLQGLFTHLPVSDEADPAWTKSQVARFAQAVDAVHEAIGRRVDIVHSSNSGAILGHEEAWLDMVRPGIMLYGFYPDEGTPRTIELKPGLSFISRVSFVKKIAAGTSIGYGRTWTASRDTRIATIPAGYADGLNRLFSNKGRVLIGGRSYPIVGRVCMDQSMVELGPDSSVGVGDEVTLIGSQGDETIDAYEWAKALGTITYEVTCQINSRVERIYDPY